MIRPIWSWFAKNAKPPVETVSKKRVVFEKWLRADSLHRFFATRVHILPLIDAINV
jgi:hypothetical protein